LVFFWGKFFKNIYGFYKNPQKVLNTNSKMVYFYKTIFLKINLILNVLWIPTYSKLRQWFWNGQNKKQEWQNHLLIETKPNDSLFTRSQQHAQYAHAHFKASTFNKLMKLEPWSEKDPTYSSLSLTLHPKLQLNNKLKAQVENGFGFYLWICIGMWTCETINNHHR
jgi:hypothetical protein